GRDLRGCASLARAPAVALEQPAPDQRPASDRHRRIRSRGRGGCGCWRGLRTAGEAAAHPAPASDPRHRTRVGPAVPIDSGRIEAAVVELLRAIGEDPARPGLERTPQRIAASYAELFAGIDEDPLEHLAA